MKELLEAEGSILNGDQIVDFYEKFWNPGKDLGDK